MKTKIISLIIIALPMLVNAQCDDNINLLKAEYQITVERINQPHQQLEKKSIVFWRKNSEVAYQHLDKQVTEIWNKVSNGTVRPIRYFDRYQHGIEYQPTELEVEDRKANWQTKYQILSPAKIKQMKKLNEQNEGCQRLTEYRLEDKNISNKLLWSSAYKLPKYYEVKTDSHLIKWALTSVESDAKKVNQFFKQKHSYRTTDFADIGDNESDPFLTKMINLGFVSAEVAEPIRKKRAKHHGHSH
ncbi:hypothetical protein FLL45_07965 [Aliikangiella marina]|uniref:Uncharacterized protein n=1 Tax=Aliikangiella marina TaxID=1712262 RepID=A0A545TCE1_9GAMM|nr:hypothetical protein [Aliikangiella marina]TQV74887.1 hypothetical protein FLL45_07965 [Aliikangiella marina]